METKYGFKKMTANEFANYLENLKIARTILRIQQHHTYIPSYIHFSGGNHFELQKGMQSTHKYSNGWNDIGQHISIFPDGYVVTGRDFEKSPAGIAYNNQNSFCIENIGNFDKNMDDMRPEQRDAIITVTAALCKKIGKKPDTNSIVYHHWYNLSTGIRNNGSGGNKSCPGTAFFGGNKVADCEKHFLPLVEAKLKGKDNRPTTVAVEKYVFVTASSLNIRKGPAVSFGKTTDRSPATYGSILRIFEEKNGWYKISSSTEHWVFGKYTKDVQRAIVSATALNIRSGPGTKFHKVGSIQKDTETFIFNEKDNWAQISIESKWVSMDYLKKEK